MPQVPRKCASLLLRSDTHEPDERDMRVLLLLAYWVRYIAIPTLPFSMVHLNSYFGRVRDLGDW